MTKEQQYKYKGNRCSICGMTVQEMVSRYGTFSRMFELHHIDPDKKDSNYNNLIKQNLSAKQLDEIDKCILLCRVCHGVVHAQDVKINGEIKLSFNGREVSQKISGWLVIDQKKQSFQFLCEEKLLIEPYVDQVAKQSKGIIFGVDINDGNHLISQIKLLKNNESYKVWKAETNELMLQVTRRDQTLIFEIKIAFRFCELDGSGLPKGERYWYRNGIILYENGEVQTEGVLINHLDIDYLP
ncbi:HNH endonuclease [Paraglaciecola marina]|uniref:HNH endonuclease signature motif containing protein n=1 Tax=Paraglaciecola marina TaxID=2500157 RepID=UPI0010623501|nr:HNH endonuclease [Paraglaciecola marina]